MRGRRALRAGPAVRKRQQERHRKRREVVGVVVGSLRLDVLLGDVHSLKGKRSLVRPVVAELRRRFEVSAAETGAQALHRRAELGVAVVGTDVDHVRSVLQGCEQLVAGRPELELLSARTRVWDDEDE